MFGCLHANEITENRIIGEFDEIHITGNFDVKLISGKEGKITLEGPEDLINEIRTEVQSGGRLVIRPKLSRMYKGKTGAKK